MNEMMIEDKIVYVGKFQKRTDRPQTKDTYTNVYLKNLSTEVSDDELKAMIAEFGETTSIVIMKVCGEHELSPCPCQQH